MKCKWLESWRTDFKCAKSLHAMKSGYIIISKASHITWDGVDVLNAIDNAKEAAPVKRDGWYCPKCDTLIASEIEYGKWMEPTDGMEYCMECGKKLRWK